MRPVRPAGRHFRSLCPWPSARASSRRDGQQDPVQEAGSQLQCHLCRCEEGRWPCQCTDTPPTAEVLDSHCGGGGGSSSNFCILDFLSILSPTPLFFNVASVPTWHNSGQSVEAVLSVCHGSDSEFPDRSHV